MQVTGCLPKNDTDCGISAIRSPLNVTSTISITLNRKHNGAEFRCAAQLDLGPQTPPASESDPLNITVHCKITLHLLLRSNKWDIVRISDDGHEIVFTLTDCVILAFFSQQISQWLTPQSFQRRSLCSEVILRSLSVKLTVTRLQRSSGSTAQTKCLMSQETRSSCLREAFTTAPPPMKSIPSPIRWKSF